jgi:hypothetical protein
MRRRGCGSGRRGQQVFEQRVEERAPAKEPSPAAGDPVHAKAEARNPAGDASCGVGVVAESDGAADDVLVGAPRVEGDAARKEWTTYPSPRSGRSNAGRMTCSRDCRCGVPGSDRDLKVSTAASQGALTPSRMRRAHSTYSAQQACACGWPWVMRDCSDASRASAASVPRCQSASGSTRISEPLPLSISPAGPASSGALPLLSAAIALRVWLPTSKTRSSTAM